MEAHTLKHLQKKKDAENVVSVKKGIERKNKKNKNKKKKKKRPEQEEV